MLPQLPDGTARDTPKALRYFKINAHRLSYACSREHGLFIGSGGVEADWRHAEACFQGQRVPLGLDRRALCPEFGCGGVGSIDLMPPAFIDGLITGNASRVRWCPNARNACSADRFEHLRRTPHPDRCGARCRSV